jgi:uncharacterized protein YndB with AHSA1/START domain
MAESRASIRVDYEFAEPPEAVWEALTKRELLARWLMPNDINPEVGHKFTFRGQATPSWDGIVHCEILEVSLHKRLVYSWRSSPAGTEENAGGLDTIVSWNLSPTPDGGTHLLLEHNGFEPDSFVFKAMSGGWSGKLGSRLREVVTRSC